MIRVKIKKLHENAVIPQYQTKGAAGFDFHAIEDIEIGPRQTKLVKTGLSVEIPEGYEAFAYEVEKHHSTPLPAR